MADELARERIRTNIAPNLIVPDGVAAIDFYRRALGAVVLHQVGEDAGVAQLAVDGAEFWLAGESDELGRFSPNALRGRSVGMILTVDDPDHMWQRAVDAGATPEYPMEDAHGWRVGSVIDPFGHRWELGRPLIPWPPSQGYSADAVDDLEREFDAVARETAFSGAIRADRDGRTVARAYGFAHRGHRIPNTVDTRFGIASGTKGLTALTVVSLIEQGVLGWDTTARVVLGSDLPLIDDRVTVEHLLAHRSGIGDYMDEGEGHTITDYAMRVPVHQLATTEQYLSVLDGRAMKFEPDARFEYCNSGFVLLALIAERAAGEPFHELVVRRVCQPAGMIDTEFLRSDELPGRTAVGYLFEDGERTNVLHLPVRGSGDGGISSTVADMRAFWTALFAGRIVSREAVARMVRPRSEPAYGTSRYGLGFWLPATGTAVELEGYDAGVSFRSLHDPASDVSLTVVANTSDGAWPVLRRLQPLFGFAPG